MAGDFTIVVKLFEDTANRLFADNPEQSISVSMGLFNERAGAVVVPGRPGGNYAIGSESELFSTVANAVMDEAINAGKSIYIWADTVGAAAFTSVLIDYPEIARGRLEIPLSSGIIRGQVAQRTTPNELYFEVGVTRSVVQWVADQMAANAGSPQADEMRRLNSEAEELQDMADNIDPHFERSEGLVLADGSAVRRIMEPQTSPTDGNPLTVMGFPIPGTRRLEANEIAARRLASEARSLEGQAQSIMRGLGRPPISDGLKASLIDRLYNGPNAWELKRPIQSAWGVWCRLGNLPWYVLADNFSNLHFGYAGAAAGFSQTELEYNAHAGSLIRNWRRDDPRDQLAAAEGMELHRSTGASVQWEDIVEILNQNSEFRENG